MKKRKLTIINILLAVIGVSTWMLVEPANAHTRSHRVRKVFNVSQGQLILVPPSLKHKSRIQAEITTQGTFCADCASRRLQIRSEGLNPLHVAGSDRSISGSGNACLRKQLLDGAKATVARLFRNRPYSTGKCAFGSRTSLSNSGVARVGAMGDAVTWHINGRLKRLGFQNILRPGLNAYNAPPGSVLIFRGPGTNMSSPSGGLPSRRNRHGRGAGYWVGHVTIKGDRPGQYYTDGRTAAPAVAGRTLVAVYVPVKCVACSTRVQRACGG